MQKVTDVNDFITDTIHKLFEKQVQTFPDRIAITYDNLNITYEALNKKSNRLAHYLLQEHEVKPESLIGLFLDRSELILISILGVLKAGSAYVPISPDYPDKRIESILQITGVKLIFTNQKYKHKLEKLINNMPVHYTREKPNVVAIDDSQTEKKLFLCQESNPTLNVISSNLAYVITTSGSTGVPKLVMVEHKGIINLRNHFGNKFNLNPHDDVEVILQMANYTFDGLMEEIILSLLYGNKLLLVRNQLWAEKDIFYQYLNKNKVTHIEITPSLSSLYDFSKLSALKRVEVAGEPLTEQCFGSLNLKENCELINAYGTTETSMVSTLKFLKHNEDITIGQAVANTRLYVLDTNLSSVPEGVVGELYISGIGLARGYLGNPGATAEKFIANPFISEFELMHSRLYKTGDLVKWLPGGDLCYLGRNDFQVKIRGYRIELEEIERILLEFKGIKQCVVVACGEENKYLIGYYVADYKLQEEDIINHLKSKLPHYMVPIAIMHLLNLPLTYNGKLDRKGLPKPNFINSTNYTAPNDEVEIKVRMVIAKLLDMPEANISIEDDFFNLGGNSILLVKLVTKLNNLFQVNIKFKEIFYYRTIKKISEHIRGSRENFIYKDYQITNTDEINLYKPFSLNNVQQAYLLGRFDNVELGNIATHTYTEYKFSYLNEKRLEQAFNKLMNRHLALRTVFNDGKQEFLSKVPYYVIKVHTLSNESQLTFLRAQLSHKVYEPHIYPLFDVVISKLDNNIILHVSFDALLLDANSMIIFFTELTELYANTEAQLSSLTVSYRDYMQQHDEIRSSELFQESEKYWINKLEEYNFDINLPLKTTMAKVKTPRFSRIFKIIPINIWNRLLNKLKAQHISPIAIILAVYGKVLCHWSAQEKICINLTLFNRLPLHSQINEIIGDFTVLELFNYIDDTKNTISNVLKNIHENFWNDIEHNLFDGIDFQRLIRKEKSLSNNQIIAPIVLTSILGDNNKDQDTFIAGDVFIDPSYSGVNYSISQTSQIWLDNQIYTVKTGLVVQWDYVEQLFEKDTIEAMHLSFCKLIEDLAVCDWNNDPFPQIIITKDDLELISKCNNQQHQETYENNSSDENHNTLFGRYEKVAQQNYLYNDIAIVDDATGKNYKYGQLLEDTKLLANYLINTANFEGGLIGALSEKGYNQVVSILSIMKAGGGYLPLNIDWPIARIDEILEQGNVKILLVSKSIHEKKLLATLLSKKYKLLLVEDLLLNLNNIKLLNSNIVTLPKVKDNDIAYVIFTSGSTGKPKGVTISHKGALNTIDAVNNKFNITGKDKVLALSDLSFDLSVYDIFGLLAVGGIIIFPNQENIKEPKYWLSLIDKYKISIWNTVPQLAELLIDEARNYNKIYINSLRLFLLSGDWVPTRLPNKIRENGICPGAQVISLGGATEGSIWSIWYEIQEVKKQWTSIPYGIAMPKQAMYVLNPQGQHCPEGVIGEIYIGGNGVALNYWNNHELTQNSFIYHDTLGRLYKTGDLGRWNRSGYMEFIGRKDNQVKIRGYRVELEEITMELLKLDEIEAAVVKIQKIADQNYIVGYVVPKNHQLSNIEYLKTSLKQVINQKLLHKLPKYMMPHDYIIIDKLPLNINGKLELTKLPLLEINEQNSYVAPRNDQERIICNVLARILGLSEDKISINDNFFELGGNSLFAIQLITSLNNKLNCNLKLRDIYKFTSINNIMEKINEHLNNEAETGII